MQRRYKEDAFLTHFSKPFRGFSISTSTSAMPLPPGRAEMRHAGPVRILQPEPERPIHRDMHTQASAIAAAASLCVASQTAATSAGPR